MKSTLFICLLLLCTQCLCAQNTISLKIVMRNSELEYERPTDKLLKKMEHEQPYFAKGFKHFVVELDSCQRVIMQGGVLSPQIYRLNQYIKDIGESLKHKNFKYYLNNINIPTYQKEIAFYDSLSQSINKLSPLQVQQKDSSLLKATSTLNINKNYLEIDKFNDQRIGWHHNYGAVYIGSKYNDVGNQLSLFLQRKMNLNLLDVNNKEDALCIKYETSMGEKKYLTTDFYLKEGVIEKIVITGDSGLVVDLFVRYWYTALDFDNDKKDIIVKSNMWGDSIELNIFKSTTRIVITRQA